MKIVKPDFVWFCMLEESKFFVDEGYYDKLQPYFREGNLELHYIDTDSFIFSLKPVRGLIEKLEQLIEDLILMI